MTVRVPAGGNPLIRRFFQILQDENVTLDTAAARARITPQTFWHWRLGNKSPQLRVFEAALRGLGYRLAIVRIDRDLPEEQGAAGGD